MNNETSTASTERAYTNLEVIYAWICYFAGYLFCRVIPLNDHPFGAFLFIVGLYIITIVVLLIKKVRPGFMSWLIAFISLATSASFIITSNKTLIFFAYLFALLTYFYFVYSACGNALRKGLSDLIIVDYLNAFFACPFTSFSQMTKAMFSNKSNKSSKVISRSLLGLVIALIPTAIVLILLSYDSNFWNLFKEIFDLSIGDIFSHLASFGFAFLIGMYFYGAFFSSVNNKKLGMITAESCSNDAVKMRIIPTATAVASVVPLIIIYVLFFISQWNYYISGFTGILPEEFSYSEYAVEGFFQLCAVSFINLLIIISTSLFMRRTSEKMPATLRIINTIFAVFTLVLISTAVAKMVMYIDCYGLTPKRVYASWLMGVLTLVFVIVLLKQFIPKFRAIGASFMVCVLLFSGLSISGIDTIIVEYNVTRYLEGSLDSINIQDMIDLGDAAVPALVRMYEEIDKSDEHYNVLRNRLQTKSSAFKNKEKTFFAFNYPSQNAEAALRRVGLLK